jgi:hypothetical protein
VDVQTGTVHRVVGEEGKGAVVGLAFQPNGPWLACTVEAPGEVRIYDTSTGTLVRRWSDMRILGDVVFHPDGNRLAVASREGFVTLYDPRTGQEVLTLKALTGRGLDLAFPPRVAFSPDGRRLVANDYDTGFWVWQADAPRTSGSAFDYHLQAAAFAQERNQVTAFRFHSERLKRIASPTGRPVRDLAYLLAREGDWSGTTTNLRRWLAAYPSDTWLSDWPEQAELLALSLLLSGDSSGYRDLCGRLHRSFRDADRKAGIALTRMVVWGDNALEPAALRALAHRFLERQPKEARLVLLLGLAQFRAGNHAEAQLTLSKALSAGKDDTFVEVSAHLGLALVHHRCARAEHARRHRLAADEMGDRTTSLRHPDNPNLPEWLAYRALREEVRRTLWMSNR